MTYKKIILVLAIMLPLVFSVGCKGSVEQPNFVSILSKEKKESVSEQPEKEQPDKPSDEENSGQSLVVLSDFELLADNQILLTFKGTISTLSVQAFRNQNDEPIKCIVEELNSKGSNAENNSEKNDKIVSNSKFKVIPSEEFKIGESFRIDGIVESNSGVLDFSLPFQGLNSNPAKMRMIEMKLGSTTKYGFIKFKVLEGGNLFGLKLEMPAHTYKKATEYIFPVSDVKTGEEVVYHWFIPKGADEEAVDEINDSIKSTHNWSVDNARDFWGKFEKFNPKRTNVILLRTCDDGQLQDSILVLNPKEEDDWDKDGLIAARNEAVSAGVWTPDSNPENVICENVTATKILKKDLSKVNEVNNKNLWKMEKASNSPNE